jgi:hypothetical protein
LAIACSVLLAAVVLISAGRPAAAAAAVTDRCATCNRDCVAGCTDVARVACKLECEIEITSYYCELCKAQSFEPCSALCYDEKSKVAQGCRDDVATLCRDCRNACLTSSFSMADAVCGGECAPAELCLRCAAAGEAESVRCDDACVASSSSDRFSSCADDLACGSGGSSTSKCVRCPSGPGICAGCKSREQKKWYQDCLARDCVQGSGCTSLLQAP